MQPVATSNIILHRVELSVIIDKTTLSQVNCNDAPYSGKCPFSYYCDTNTGECKKCLGKFTECTDRSTPVTCSRFTKELYTQQTSCNADYFNLQKLDEMTYDINPPIKSNAATLSFWLFTTEDINNAADPNIYHITLEDFFVVTIIPGKSQYTIYTTAYEMYHEAYGTILKDKKTKNEFEEVIGLFPYKNWFIKKDVLKINRWINIMVSYNKNLLRLSMQILYKKNSLTQTGNINGKEFLPLPGEYIYNNENNIIKSTLHFKKYYRNSDTTHLNIKIYDNNIGVYFRKIYVFVTEILTSNSYNKL